MLSEPFDTIAKKTITEAELTKAMSRLPQAIMESPAFWSRIANDPGYPVFHRRRVIAELFHRHIHAGMRVYDLQRILDHPRWIQPDNVQRIRAISGWIPVRQDLEDSAISISILPSKTIETPSVYLSIKGDIWNEYLRRVIQKDSGKASAYAAEQMRIVANSVIKDKSVCYGPYVAYDHKQWKRLM